VRDILLTSQRAAVAADVPGCRRVYGTAQWRVPDDVADILGYGPPAPRTGWMDAPTSVPLRVAQQADLAFLRMWGGGIIAHRTSGGKSLVGLAAAASYDAKNVLFAGPALARFTWQREVRKWFPDRTLNVLRGVRPTRITTEGWHFVNYEIAEDWATALSALDWDMLVLDEIHALRGRKSRWSIGMRGAIAACAPIVVGLSATPIWSRGDGLYNQLDMVHPGAFGSFGAFTRRYAGADVNLFGGYTIRGATHTDELRLRLERTIRREVNRDALAADLPPVHRTLIGVDHPGARHAIAESMRRLKDNATQDDTRRALAKALYAATPKKIPVLKKLIVEAEVRGQHTFLVSVQREEAVNAIVKALASTIPAHGIVGSRMPLARRLRLVEEVMAVGRGVIVTTSGAMRESVDCSGLAAGYCVELPWTIEEALQLEGRLARTGRKDPVPFGYVVVEGSYDQLLVETLIDKVEDRAKLLPGDDELGDTLRGVGTVDTILARLGL